jgi:hypothetical protein
LDSKKKSRFPALGLGRPSRTLVFETTGCALYGLVATRGRAADPEFSPVAVSREVDFEKAVAEVRERLAAATGRRLPKTAVLVTPSAVGTLTSLPVSPQKPRPREQMKELVRWELQDLFARQDLAWSLGALLVGRGYLTPDERAELEADGNRGGAELYAGMATRAQLDECRALQEALLSGEGAEEDDIAAAWVAQAAAEETGPFTWHVAGIGDALRRRWVRAFKKNGISCSVIYPQLGAAIPLAGAGAGDDEGWLLADVRQEQFGMFHGEGGRLVSAATKACAGGVFDPLAAAEAARRPLRSGVRKVYCAAEDGQADALRAALEDADPGGTVEFIRFLHAPGLGADGGGCPVAVFASLRGAAMRALAGRAKTAAAPAGISASPPRPPAWKDRNLWPWAAIALLALGFAGLDTWMRSEAKRLDWEKEKLDIERDRRQRVIRETQGVNAESRRLAAELAAVEAELRMEQSLREFRDTVVAERLDFAPEALKTIAEAVTDDIVLTKIEEGDNGAGFALSGNAARDTAGLQFSKRLTDAFAPWGYRVDDMQIDRTGATGQVGGFSFRLLLAKPPQKAAAPEAATGAAESETAGKGGGAEGETKEPAKKGGL